ncbi:AfsR/SARP family transcriptional regulator [Virgisporangium aurantiacum]|uniref:SARP family transcriptional regulator n=1 Tax=Virgisporangium aurantiacum TaxID=175570 RepID=A0A8J3Z799_9ACTN|nr:BTAD domain-containing putative transcriptional regulator [Virgisporangium aurantiacum]GIJ57697.1 SARP family transcriptional regulator [Virgisporangium aurantiacum]
MVAVELRIQVLGRVRGWHGDVELDLGPARRRAVFALLALAAGRPITRADLIDSLWGEHSPPSATNIIQTHVKHLRRLVDPDRPPRASSTVLPTIGDGYALNIRSGGVDLVRFRELVVAAGTAHDDGDLDRTAALLGRALALWQGAPLSDVPLLATHPKVVALLGERRSALARYGEAMVAVGAAAEALPALEEAAAEQPLDEAAQARLILAYRSAGRRAQAFAAFHTTRGRLAQELGVDPGPELAEAYRVLLAGTGTGAAPERPQPLRHPVPAQLPSDIAAFAGRVAHLRHLDGLLPRDDGTRPPAVVISALSGTAGVGKTALAVHWAHRIVDRFPDGQLYTNLRGFDPAGSPRTTAETVRGFLEAFAVPPDRVPAGLEAQIGLYRSLLAGMRVLILLDNARDAEQVRPLLPGAPGCLAVVTSRNRLTGLVASEGAHPLMLDLLSRDEARELLARRLGRARVAAEPAAVDEIVTRCARLPLALAVVAAQAAERPATSLSTLAGGLRDAHGRLDALAEHDPGTDVRAVFSWSYRTLRPSTARLFRFLGLHPGPDVAAPAAASLVGVPVAEITDALAELNRAHLVVADAAGRHTMHDLLRAYAAELSATHDTDEERTAALGRVLDHYLLTSLGADKLLFPHRDRITPAPPRDAVAIVDLTDSAAAKSWFAAERATLLAAIRHAAATGFDTHAWQLSWSLDTYLHWRGHWQHQADNHRVGLAAANRAADPAGQAHAHRHLARAYGVLGRHSSALAHYRHALDLYGQLGDAARQAHTHVGFGIVFERQGRRDDALGHAEEALRLYRAAGHRVGQANALNNLGWCHAQLGNHERALAYCEQALALQREMGDRDGEAATWDSLGFANHRLDRFEDAVRCYRHALDLRRDLGDRYYEAATLVRLGDTHAAADGHDAARDAWRDALDILDDLHHGDADQVRAKLRSGHGPVPDQSAPRSCRVETPGASPEATKGERKWAAGSTGSATASRASPP